MAKVLGGSNVDEHIFSKICQGDHAGFRSCMFHHEGEIIKMIRNNGSTGESLVGGSVING